MIYVTNNYYSWKGGDTYMRYKEFNELQQYDILFVGSSRAYRGYSPYIFAEHKYSSFNLGSSAQSIKNTYFVIKHYITQINCKVLVLDIFAGAFSKDQLESSSDLIENISKPVAAYDIAWHSKDVRTINLSALRFLSEKDTAYFQQGDYVGRGYSSKTDSMPLIKRQRYLSHEKLIFDKMNVDKEQLEYFTKIVSLCKERGVKLVCVYSPVSYFYDYNQHAEFTSQLKSSINENEINFYDFNKLEQINTLDHFYDNSHLNQAGVELFNKELIKKMQIDNVLKCKQ